MMFFEVLTLFLRLQVDRPAWMVWVCQDFQGIQKTG